MLAEKLISELHRIGKEAERQNKDILKDRCLPDELILDLKKSGAFKLWIAAEYGGLQASVADLSQAVQILAQYNGSIAWILGVTGTAALGSGYLEKDFAREIFGDPLALTGGWAAPVGKAKKEKNGIKVSGKWSWGSGIRHCSHIVAGAMLIDDNNEKPRSILVYLKPEDVQFIDNWNVLGLNGTNSIDYAVENAFVPNGNWMFFPVVKPKIDAALYRFSFLGALASGVASVALGLAKRAIDEIIILATEKVPSGGRKTLGERAVIQEKVALMKAKYLSCKSFLENAIEKNWSNAAGRIDDISTKSELRLATTFTVSECCEIVSQAYKIGGGSSIWDGVKLQELLKDIHVVSQHGMVSSNNYEIAGRVAFGLKVNEWLL